jgi:hypothetical protein
MTSQAISSAERSAYTGKRRRSLRTSAAFGWARSNAADRMRNAVCNVILQSPTAPIVCNWVAVADPGSSVVRACGSTKPRDEHHHSVDAGDAVQHRKTVDGVCNVLAAVEQQARDARRRPVERSACPARCEWRKAIAKRANAFGIPRSVLAPLPGVELLFRDRLRPVRAPR